MPTREERTRQRIIHYLKRFPRLPLSLLGLATRHGEPSWRRILEQMVDEGLVVRTIVYDGDRGSFVLSLAPKTAETGAATETAVEV